MGEVGPEPAGADDADGATGRDRHHVVDPVAQLGVGDVHRAGQVAQLELASPADVEDEGRSVEDGVEVRRRTT